MLARIRVESQPRSKSEGNISVKKNKLSILYFSMILKQKRVRFDRFRMGVLPFC